MTVSQYPRALCSCVPILRADMSDCIRRPLWTPMGVASKSSRARAGASFCTPLSELGILGVGSKLWAVRMRASVWASGISGVQRSDDHRAACADGGVTRAGAEVVCFTRPGVWKRRSAAARYIKLGWGQGASARCEGKRAKSGAAARGKQPARASLYTLF